MAVWAFTDRLRSYWVAGLALDTAVPKQRNELTSATRKARSTPPTRDSRSLLCKTMASEATWSHHPTPATLHGPSRIPAQGHGFENRHNRRIWKARKKVSGFSSKMT